MTCSGRSTSPALVPIASALSLYSVGAGVVEGFVAHPSWREVAAAEFVAFHRVTDRRVTAVLVIPFCLATAATAWLVARPAPTRQVPNLVLAVVAVAMTTVVATRPVTGARV